jgi:hypothetical protein
VFTCSLCICLRALFRNNICSFFRCSSGVPIAVRCWRRMQRNQHRRASFFSGRTNPIHPICIDILISFAPVRVRPFRPPMRAACAPGGIDVAVVALSSGDAFVFDLLRWTRDSMLIRFRCFAYRSTVFNSCVPCRWLLTMFA